MALFLYFVELKSFFIVAYNVLLLAGDISFQAYDWWLDDMYLNNRNPLPINSSPGMVFPVRQFSDINEQLRLDPKQ